MSLQPGASWGEARRGEGPGLPAGCRCWGRPAGEAPAGRGGCQEDPPPPQESPSQVQGHQERSSSAMAALKEKRPKAECPGGDALRAPSTMRQIYPSTYCLGTQDARRDVLAWAGATTAPLRTPSRPCGTHLPAATRHLCHSPVLKIVIRQALPCCKTPRLTPSCMAGLGHDQAGVKPVISSALCAGK